MKLYVSPGACSMSCHIAFEEAQLKFEPMISKWDEVAQLNPQGAVPVLVFDDGQVMTQNIGILSYAADAAPASGLLPKVGSRERAQAFQWLSWVGSDLHPTFGPLFGDDLPEQERKDAISSVHDLLQIAEQHLTGKTYLVGNQFTVADAYFFTVYGWARAMKLDIEKYRSLNAYAGRVAERPAVQTVMKREGLIK